MIKKILSPFKVIKLQKGTFFLWFIFTLLAGLLGPLINIINNCGFNDMSIWSSIQQDAESGTFYTYAIVLIASSIGSLFINVIDNAEIFKKLKLYFVAVCIFPMFFGGICYSSYTLQQKSNVKNHNINTQVNNNISTTELTEATDFDGIQCSFFVISIIVAIYGFCLQYINANPEKFKELQDNYLEEENDKVTNLGDSLEKKQQFGGADL